MACLPLSVCFSIARVQQSNPNFDFFLGDQNQILASFLLYLLTYFFGCESRGPAHPTALHSPGPSTQRPRSRRIVPAGLLGELDVKKPFLERSYSSFRARRFAWTRHYRKSGYQESVVRIGEVERKVGCHRSKPPIKTSNHQHWFIWPKKSI